jgi:hypothetical protein
MRSAILDRMKLFRLATAAALGAAAIWACGGDDTTTPGDAGSDGAADAAAGDGGGGGDSATDSGPTVPPPSSLTFLDFDPSDGGVDGYIHVGHAADDSTLTGYSVFYGKSATEKLQNTPITTVPKSVPETSGFPLSVNPIPAGATFLLAYSETAGGGESAPVAVKLDRTPAFVDLDPDAGMNYMPSIVLDTVNRKVLVGYSATDGYPHVARCELDGTGCTTHVLANGGATVLTAPSLAIDKTNGSLLAAWSGSNLWVARCSLDLTSCNDIDVSTGKPGAASLSPGLTIDSVEQKILISARDGTNGSRPGLFYCDLAIGVDGGAAVREDGGASCSFVDISAGAPASSGEFVWRPVFEAVAGKLVVVSQDSSKNDTTSVFRCNVDGTSCTYTNITGDAGTGSGLAPSMLYDPSDDSVYVTTTNVGAGYAPVLLHCDPAFATCTRVNVAAAAGAGAGAYATSALDDSNEKIFIALQDPNAKPSVVRCNRADGGCSSYDMSAGQPSGSGAYFSVVADPTSSLFIATLNGSVPGNKVSLFLLR